MSIVWEMDGSRLYQGHVLEVLSGMEAESVQMCVTSPPYLGLRDYGIEPQVWPEVLHFDGFDHNRTEFLHCEHEWGDEITTGSKGHPGDKTTLVGTQTADISKAAQGQGQFCLHCNAWRGSLGLEPDPSLYISLDLSLILQGF